jgi:hypothetical protein
MTKRKGDSAVAINCATVSCAEGQHVVQFASRDWKLLTGPHVAEGNGLLALLGALSPQPLEVSRQKLLEAARAVLEVVERDRELLEHDYQFQFSAAPAQVGEAPNSGGASGFTVDGRPASIWAREPGHCYLVVAAADGQQTIRDLREERRAQTDDWGDIRVHRRRRGLAWPVQLPLLVDFLDRQEMETVTVDMAARR